MTVLHNHAHDGKWTIKLEIEKRREKKKIYKKRRRRHQQELKAVIKGIVHTKSIPSQDI